MNFGARTLKILTVGNNVDSSETLQEHERHAETHSVANALLEQLLEHLLLRQAVIRALLNLRANIIHLAADVLVVRRQAPQLH